MNGWPRAVLWAVFGLLVGVALSMGVAAIADPGEGGPTPEVTISVPSPTGSTPSDRPSPRPTRSPEPTRSPSVRPSSSSETPTTSTPTSSSSSGGDDDHGGEDDEHEDDDDD